MNLLAGLRQQLQESDPEAWPAAADRELFVLADVAALLGAGELETLAVLGAAGYNYVRGVETTPAAVM